MTSTLKIKFNNFIYESYCSQYKSSRLVLYDINNLIFHTETGLLGISGGGGLYRFYVDGKVENLAKVPVAGNINICYNPFTNQISIESSIHFSKIELTDAAGRVILITEKQFLNTSNLKPGIYYLKIKEFQELKIYKIIKI